MLSAHIKTSIIFVGYMILTGCATSNINKEFDFIENSQTGVVIGSLTQDVSGSAYARYYMQSVTDSSKPITLHSRQQNLSGLMPGFVKSEFIGMDGRLFTIELVEGEYKFTHWDVNSGSTNYFPVKLPTSLKFEVTAGEIVYLGNIHMRLIDDGMLPYISNKSERDIALFKQKYPKLTDHTIQIRPLAQGLWHSESDINDNLPIGEKPRFK
ncbi:MAG: hypothetical protein ACN4GM_05115 [Gammaproteobacteria bacterium]